jgi:hypothetical protein
MLSYYVSIRSEFHVVVSVTISKAFEETPTHMSIKINRLEEGHNSYPLLCRRPAEAVSLKGDKYVIDEEEPLISHTGILMTFYLSIILYLQNFSH